MVGTMEQTVADARGYFSGWRSVTFDRIAGEGWSHKKSPRVLVSGTKTKPRKWARFVGQMMKSCFCDHKAVLFFEPKIDPFSKTRATFLVPRRQKLVGSGIISWLRALLRTNTLFELIWMSPA